MKLRLKISLAIAFILLGMYVCHFGFLLLNLPYTLAVAGGFALLAVVFIVFPTLFWWIIKPRSKKSNDSQENPTS
jgi:hypothetical protein